MVCPFQVTIAACHPVTLSKQEFDEQRADRADAQDEDPHGAEAYHSSLAGGRNPLRRVVAQASHRRSITGATPHDRMKPFNSAIDL